MANIPNKTIVHDSQKTFLVKKTAELHNCSTSLVYKVLSGERTNENILMTYMDLLEGTNGLLEAVKTLVPFN